VATDVVRLLGAKPFFIDAVEHDGLAAGAEQLPLVLALVAAADHVGEASWREMRKLAGPVFEDATRVTSQDLENSRDTLLMNRDNVLRLIEAWVEELYNLRELIRSQDEKGLQGLMEAGVAVHQSWLKDRGVGLWEQPEGPDIPTGGDSWAECWALAGSRIMAEAYIYMVECADGTLYTGWTTTWRGRVAMHNAGRGADYTRQRLPVRLVYWEKHANRACAQRRELQLKRMNRARKLLLIARARQ